MADSRSLPTLSPRALTGSYLAFGMGWILFTDLVVRVTFGASPRAGRVQMLKGAVFVVGTGLFVYLAVRRRDERLTDERASLRTTRNRLESIIEASPVPILALDVDAP